LTIEPCTTSSVHQGTNFANNAIDPKTEKHK